MFEELDNQATPLGRISLRRRTEPVLGVEVYEVKLDEAFLMSSLFTAAETALATRALARIDAVGLDVLVGGLGLGYTAAAVLDDPRVSSLAVVEALEAVIGWHRAGLVPLGGRVAKDARCRLVCADFFATIGAGHPLAGGPATYDAILVDIDHSPTNLLAPAHAGFYGDAGLARAAGLLRPGGVLGLWADGAPDDGFLAVARGVFARVDAETVAFDNPLTGGTSASTVYLAGA